MTTVVGDGTLHYFKDGEWRALLGRPVATGGQVTLIEDDGEEYWCHIFRESDDFVTPVSLDVDYLVVAGGGGGGTPRANQGSGGGGAGGVRFGSTTVFAGTYPAVVGAGASTNPTTTSTGPNGGFSSVFGVESAGGGAGVYPIGGTNGVAGGSGGGGWGTQTAGTGNTPSVVPSQGNDGGAGIGSVIQSSGGGGGGAEAAGQAATTNNIGGDGGDGVQVSITGTAVYYGGGGGGGAASIAGNVAGSGGLGGGGDGSSTTVQGSAGVDGLGGGGGGSCTNRASFSGGNGAVIVRYKVRP